jgi:hypothetical protein
LSADIDSGQVVEVLADSKQSLLTLYDLYSVRKLVPPKLVQCIEYLEQWFTDKDKL